jgi:hypothetical protein
MVFRKKKTKKRNCFSKESTFFLQVNCAMMKVLNRVSFEVAYNQGELKRRVLQ